MEARTITHLNDSWVYLRPGDFLRLWNERGGIENALIIAVVDSDDSAEYRKALVMSRSLGMQWVSEYDLLDSKRYEKVEVRDLETW